MPGRPTFTGSGSAARHLHPSNSVGLSRDCSRATLQIRSPLPWTPGAICVSDPSFRRKSFGKACKRGLVWKVLPFDWPAVVRCKT